MTNEVSISQLSRLAGLYQGNTRPASPAPQEKTGGADQAVEAVKVVGQQGASSTDVGLSSRVLETSELSGKKLEAAVNQLNDLAQSIRRELKFSMDEASGRTVIEVYDSDTDELIRQIPAEQVLSVIQHLQEFESGLLQEKA